MEIHEKLGKHHNYKIIRKLGWGQFSTVWLAYNSIDSQHYALKIVKSAPRYTEAALDEIKILEKINTTDPSHPGFKHLVTLHEWFYHTGPNGQHVVMAFEVLGENLLGLLQGYKTKAKEGVNLEELGESFGGLPIPIVKRISKQICLALDYLHRSCGLIHTDLKLENILIEIKDVERFVTLCQEHTQNGPIKSSNPLQSPLLSQHSFKKSKSSSGSASTNSSISYRGNYTTSIIGNSTSMSPTFQARVPSSVITSANVSDDEEEAEGDVQGEGEFFSITRRQTTTSTSEVDSDDEDDGCFQQEDPYSSKDSEADDITQLINIKIADLGNACHFNRHYSNDIQTRQYRAPEILLGASWGCSTDCWSVACLIFELITGDYLFNPKCGKNYDRNDDHIAQILELLNPEGAELLSFLQKCDYNTEYFEIVNKKIELQRIKHLKYWPLVDVLKEKYHMPQSTALEVADFLNPLLSIIPKNRPDLGGWSNHKWLESVEGFVNRPCGCHGENIKGWDCRYREEKKRSRRSRKSAN